MEKGCFDHLFQDVPVLGARNAAVSPIPALPKVFLGRTRRPLAKSSHLSYCLWALEPAAAPRGGISIGDIAGIRKKCFLFPGDFPVPCGEMCGDITGILCEALASTALF